ncbi:uncharacterized protein LOC143210244 isoform X1 [Lasioglossum baleicum]|uniref:uncharacterized protein LOC143210244 isoform X1 n=1 Tax=Lasioglossum baleicum TaxID=434251 RepID=UPI003FCEA939
MESRNHGKLFLLEHDESQIVGAKLPSIGQVLRVLFYNLRKVKLNLRSSPYLVVKEVEVLWEKVKIPFRQSHHSIEKLESLYQKWRLLQKNSTRRSQLQDNKEQQFLDQLDDLFDIAHVDALEMITIDEDKQFLLNQRKKGRPGSMIGGVRVLSAKEQKQALRQAKEEARRVKTQAAMQEETINFASIASPDDDEENRQCTEDEDEDPALESNASDCDATEPGPSKPKRKRGSKQVITLKLMSTLDACKVSDRDAARIIVAISQALGHDINDLTISRSSIRRYRTELRKKHSQMLRAAFSQHEIDAVTVHWDGKMLPALVGKEKVERLPVVITCRGREHLLGVPIIPTSTGRDQALAVHDLLKEWDICDKVQALSCDTTASNMGHLQGACVILEHVIGRYLLYLPCRHHMYEIVLSAVFEKKMSQSTGPNVPIFKRFQQAWPNINKLNFHCGVEDRFVNQKLENIPQLINFAKQTLEMHHPREDYREFIELVLVFLGNTSEYRFRAPGAFHHARWMAKAFIV